jgi:hypothetical protein
MPRFELGVKLRDKVSGFEGIAIARVEHLNGCTQYGISGKVGDDGKMPESYYIDHTQLEQIDTGIKVKDTADTGGATTKMPRNNRP